MKKLMKSQRNMGAYTSTVALYVLSVIWWKKFTNGATAIRYLLNKHSLRWVIFIPGTHNKHTITNISLISHRVTNICSFLLFLSGCRQIISSSFAQDGSGYIILKSGAFRWGWSILQESQNGGNPANILLQIFFATFFIEWSIRSPMLCQEVVTNTSFTYALPTLLGSSCLSTRLASTSSTSTSMVWAVGVLEVAVWNKQVQNSTNQYTKAMELHTSVIRKEQDSHTTLFIVLPCYFNVFTALDQWSGLVSCTDKIR